MTWNSVAKFLLGVSLAIAIMIGGSVVVALYFMYKVTSHPPKPVFANEKVAKVEKASTKNTTKPPSPPAKQPNTQPTSSPTPSASPSEPGAYKARVIWEQGLSLRTDPSLDAERMNVLDYDQQIVVIEESADKNWQKVRLADGGQEGWIKAGNIERTQE